MASKDLAIMDCQPPAKRRGPPRSETHAEQGKPVVLPVTAGEPQGTLLAVRVKECGESEGWPVTGRIGIASQGNIIPRESGQTSAWSFVTRKLD